MSQDAGLAAVFSRQEWMRVVCESLAGFWGFNSILLSGTNFNNSLTQRLLINLCGGWGIATMFVNMCHCMSPDRTYALVT